MKRAGLFVGLDLGATSMKAGVVHEQGRALSQVSLPTEAHRGQEHGLKRMSESIRAALQAARVDLAEVAAIGVATPGTMDLAAGMILDPPNMKPWRNVPVRQYIEDEFHLPTAFQNDANAAALGEYWVGAGRGCRSLVLFTLGTGIGGGIIIADRILEGQHSHGAELGHLRIELTKPRRCGCGRWGCLEAYASATAVSQRTREALGQPGALSRLAELAARGEPISAETVFAAAAAHDALAARIVEETAFYLAVAAVNLMHTVDPDVVVFGGGMIAAGEPLLQRIRRHVRELAFPVPAEKTRVCFAQLGADAGFIGAAACARQLLLERRCEAVQ